jgi:hypothetical protein
MASGAFDALVTTDGDADRPLVADARGRILRIGTNVSDRPIGTASAPRADSTSTSTSRATELCW